MRGVKEIARFRIKISFEEDGVDQGPNKAPSVFSL